jgi:flagellar transcriptional activator FlhD
MVAQKLIQLDKADAMSCLGVSEASADLLGALSSAQVMKLATGNTVLCRFPINDDTVWGLLTNHRLPAGATASSNTATFPSPLHKFIPVAGAIA